MQYSLLRFRRVWFPFLVFLAGITFLFVHRPVRLFPVLSVTYGQADPSPRVPWSEGGTLLVGAPEPVRQATVISPYGPGFEIELVTAFCENAPCTPEWVNVEDKEAGFAMLRRGEIDVLVGFWGDGPGEPPKAARSGEGGVPEEAAAEGPPLTIAVGKAYAHFNPIRITGAVLPGSTPEEAPPAPKPKVNAKRPRMDDKGLSPLESLSRAFATLLPEEDRKTAFSMYSPDDGQPFPVFSFVMDRNGDARDDILLLDPASYSLWLPFMGEVDTKQVKRRTPYRWFWLGDESPLANSLAGFWEGPALEDALEELTERYFGFLPRTLRQRDILELAEALESRLPTYRDFILNASKETGVPPLLLVAAIYQESRFDPEAVSETRVRGIMQLTAATAQMLKVDRKDPEQCIMGGARYLRDLWDKIGDKAANDWDRWFMALAAYNQGMSNLNRAIKLSQELGGKGDTWADLKQTFPLSTTCRGVEAKSFVERIRYYNFILHGLVALAPTEAEDLTPLLGLAVADNAF